MQQFAFVVSWKGRPSAVDILLYIATALLLIYSIIQSSQYNGNSLSLTSANEPISGVPFVHSSNVQQYWTTSQTQSSSSVVDEIIDTYFSLQGWEHHPVEEQRIRLTIADALTFLKTSEHTLSNMQGPDRTFLKYFPAEDFEVVKSNVNQLSTQFGAPKRNYVFDWSRFDGHLPLKVFYHSHSDDPVQACCEPKDYEPLAFDSFGHPISSANDGAHPPSLLAYMFGTGWRYASGKEVFNEGGYIAICPILLAGRKGQSNFRALQELPCQSTQDSLSVQSALRMTRPQLPGYLFTGAALVHELLHWLHTSTDEPVIVDHEFFLPTVNNTVTAYGAHAAQELAYYQPHLAATNVDNYIFFLQEKFWQYRCKGKGDWQGTPVQAVIGIDFFSEDPEINPKVLEWLKSRKESLQK